MQDTTTIPGDPFLVQRGHAAELFIIRHGDAIPGPDEIIPGGIYDDLPLSSIGREQSQALAERLGVVPFAALYSSPLRRCQETAAPLAEKLGLPITIVPDVREVQIGDVIPLPDGGDLEALTEALRERQRQIARLAGASGSWDDIPGSESSRALRERVVAALDEIASRHIGERVAVFAHGGVINAYAAETLGLQKDFFFPAANTSITVVRVAGRQRVLYVLNDLAHVRRHG